MCPDAETPADTVPTRRPTTPARSPRDGSDTPAADRSDTPGERVAPPAAGHHATRARSPQPADPHRRHRADQSPRPAGLAPPRRTGRDPPRTVLLRRGPPTRPP